MAYFANIAVIVSERMSELVEEYSSVLEIAGEGSISLGQVDDHVGVRIEDEIGALPKWADDKNDAIDELLNYFNALEPDFYDFDPDCVEHGDSDFLENIEKIVDGEMDEEELAQILEERWEEFKSRFEDEIDEIKDSVVYIDWVAITQERRKDLDMNASDFKDDEADRLDKETLIEYFKLGSGWNPSIEELRKFAKEYFDNECTAVSWLTRYHFEGKEEPRKDERHIIVDDTAY